MTKYGIKRACIAIAVLFAVNIAVITLAQRADAASYKRGSTGSVVSEIQQKLKDWGYYSAVDQKTRCGPGLEQPGREIGRAHV